MDDANAREISARILREAGIDPDSTLRAKDAFDRRLEGMGLPALARPPRAVPPAKLTPPFSARDAAGAISALLVPGGGNPPNPRVVPSADAFGPADRFTSAMFEPYDLIAAQAVTGLATTAAGGTEVRFNLPGFVHVGSGAVGVYWNRALGANKGFRWVPCAPGTLIPYHPRQGLFVGTQTVGGITIGGVLTLSFYRLPEWKKGRDDARERPPSDSGGSSGDQPGDPGAIDPGGGGGLESLDMKFQHALAQHVAASGSDTTAGAFVGAGGDGPDVTLGSFSDAGVGTQIFLAGSNMPIGGASRAGIAVLNSRQANTDTVWVGETSALAVASNGAIGPSGQDLWNIPVAGQL